MEIFKIILLIIAYTLGIATIVLQILCYQRKMEPMETLHFSVSLLSLILWATLSEVIPSLNLQEQPTRFVFALLIIILGVTTPRNIHAERQVKNSKTRNQTISIIGIVLLLITIISYIGDFFHPFYITGIVFLNISIMYSMVLIIRTKPKYTIKHRDKTERRTAIFILATTMLFTTVGMIMYGRRCLNEFMCNGSFVLAIICIVLCVFKIPDDAHRLTLISNAKKFSLDNLREYQITKREREVIRLLVSGVSYKGIADKLYISLPTVKTHTSNIYQKLQVKNKVELIHLLNDKSFECTFSSGKKISLFRYKLSTAGTYY